MNPGCVDIRHQLLKAVVEPWTCSNEWTKYNCRYALEEDSLLYQTVPRSQIRNFDQRFPAYPSLLLQEGPAGLVVPSSRLLWNNESTKVWSCTCCVCTKSTSGPILISNQDQQRKVERAWRASTCSVDYSNVESIESVFESNNISTVTSILDAATGAEPE